MEEELRYRGEWWIPDSERRWSGRFSFTREQGVRLEIDASHDDGLFPPPRFGLPILLGRASDGTIFTLVDAAQVQTKTHLTTGAVEVTFAPAYTLIGAWFESEDDLVFEHLSMGLQDLDGWLDISGFKFEFRGVSEGFGIEYQVPDTAELAEVSGWKVVADFSTSGVTLKRPLVEVEARQRARVTVRHDEALRFDELLKFAGQVRNFLSFVTRRSVRVLEVTARTQVEQRFPDGSTHMASKDIKVLYATGPDDGPLEPIQAFDMLFLYGNRGGPDSPLSQWLAMRELLEPIYDLYLISLYQPKTYLHLQFLSLAQALESLHGRKSPNYELPKTEHNKRLEAILGTVPETYQDWLRQKLAQSNKATFRQAIADLVGLLPPHFRSAVGNVDDFTRLVGWTRNYYTHWDRELEKKAATGQALVELTWGLRVIAEALLLLEIGLTEADLVQIATQNRKVRGDLEFAFSSKESDAISHAAE